NVRELENCVERTLALAGGARLEVEDLPSPLRQTRLPRRESGGAALVRPLAELEREAIFEALAQVKGDKILAARLLGIGKTTLYRKLKEYGQGAVVARAASGTASVA